MKISKRTSRVMALLMTVVMLLGIMPLSVFAAEGDVAYTKISASEIAVGDEIIIVGESNNNYYALTNGTDQKTDVSVSGDTLTISGSTDKLIWTVGTATGSQVDGDNKLKFNFSNDGTYMGRISDENTVELNTSANTKYFGHVTDYDTIGNYSRSRSYYGLAYSNNQFIYVTGSNTNRNISFYKVTESTSGDEGGSTVNPNGSVVVISGSDYQDSNAGNTMTNIMNQIKKDYPSVHGILMGGDYSASMSSNASDIGNVDNVVSSVFPRIISENRIYVRGNHDSTQNGSSLLATTGAHDTDYYGVYSINYSDFGSAASGLESYLNAKVQEGYNKPIFVISHQPLHKNSRNDNTSAVNLFKHMNEAGEDGLTIIYLFGHNHSGGYDAYLGNGSIYLPKGASMDVAGGASNQKLNFTYMNCGYVGYVNGNSSTTLTMTAFEITDTEVTVKRYSVDGAVNLKAAGVGSNDYTANSTVYTSPQTIALDDSLIPPVTPDLPSDDDNVTEDSYTKVDNLANGEYIIVIGENRGLTNQIGATVSGSNSYAGLKSNKVIISEDKITDGVIDGMIWTITVNNGKITIQNENSKYLTADYGSGNTGNTRKLLLADTADANWVYTEGKLNNTSQNASQTGDYSGCYLYQTDNTTDYTISVRSLKNASNVTFYKVNRVSSEEHEHTYGAITYTGDGKTSYVAVRECTCGDKQTTTAEISYAVTTPASCTAAGIGTYTANFAEEWAQDKDTTEAIAQLGHNYGNLIAKVDPIHTATELKAGKEAHYECSACKKFFNAEKVETTEAALVIAAPTHTYGTAWESDVTNHWHECECGAITDEEKHIPGAAATESTVQLCTKCEYVITPATGHNTHIYSVFVSETPATCTQTGSKVMKCTGCDKTETTTLEIDSSNHTYGELIEKVDAVHTATELKAGKEAHYECACGKFFTEAKVATTEDELVIPAPTHSFEAWKNNEEQHWHECECGATDTAANHDFTNGDCVCGKVASAEDIEEIYTKVDKLINGQYVIVVGDDSALGTTAKTVGSTNNSNAYAGFVPEEVTILGNKIIDGVEDDMIWTVTVNGGKISIKNDKENKYLAADYGSQNYGNTRKLTLETTADSNWKYEDSLLSNTAENSGNCYLTLYTDGTIIIRSNSSATPEAVTFYKVGTGTVDPEQTVLTDIEVTSNPNKMTYVAGEDFDATGMVITAIYSNGSEKVVTDYTVSGGEDMTAGQKTITITFAEGGIEKTVTLTVTVNTEAPSNPGDTVYVAFSSDVHNSGSATNSGTSAYRLNTWLNNVSTKIGATFENMAFCGDNGSANTYDSNTYWNYVQEAMNVVANSNKVEGESIFIAGNHEYQNGSFGSISNATAAKIKTIGYTENTSDYAIYVFGAASGNQSFNTSDINNLSTWLKNNANGDKPVFVVSHFPIHYYNNRTTSNAQTLVNVLNEYPNVVFLWGHNHTLSDSHYDKVHAAGSQLQLTSSSSSKVEINFTYAAAGCMSGSEYNAASESIIGKGLVAKITDGKLVSLTYYKADSSVVSTYNHDGSNTLDIPDTPELGDKIVIISNGHVLTTAKGTDYSNTGSSSSQKYNYSGLAGEPYVEGMEYTEDMLWVMEDAGNGYFYLKNGNQYLNGSYVNNSTGGYDGSLSLGEKNDKWIWQDGMLKSYNASQGHDTGDKFLTHGNTSGGNPDVNTFTVRSGDNVNGSTEFDEVAPTEHEHTWGNVVYTFAADGLTCTAQRVCSTNASHVETATAVITSEVKTPATCTIMGTTTYTATFTEEWAKTRTKEVQDIPVLGHEWSDAEYTFAADGLTCTAQRVCANDESHVDTAEVVITSEVKIAATCEEKGTTTYTATFEEEWAEVQTKDVQDIAALEHKWGSAEYTFAADGSICVAKRVCENDPSHVQNAVAVITSEVKTPASCMEMGTTTYTATFTETWAGTQIKDVQNIPAIGSHSYKDGVCEVCGEIELKWQLGDIDHDGDVDNSDVEYLLWYTLFPEDYPTEDFVDFDHSGEVDNKDVEYLLWYTLFPEDYPLTAERNN